MYLSKVVLTGITNLYCFLFYEHMFNFFRRISACKCGQHQKYELYICNKLWLNYLRLRNCTSLLNDNITTISKFGFIRKVTHTPPPFFCTSIKFKQIQGKAMVALKQRIMQLNVDTRFWSQNLFVKPTKQCRTMLIQTPKVTLSNINKFTYFFFSLQN